MYRTIATTMAAVLIAAPALAANWTDLTKDKNGAVVALDQSASTRTGARITIPVRWTYTKASAERYPVEVDTMVFECGTDQFNIIDWTWYDDAGKVADAGKNDRSTLVPIPRNSIATAIYHAVCATT